MPNFRSMAQKESQHREIVEELNDELSRIRRQHDDLSKLSRDQVSLGIDQYSIANLFEGIEYVYGAGSCP